MVFSASFFVYVIGAALGAYFLLSGAPEETQTAAPVFIAGLLSIAAIEDMLKEAHDAAEDNRRCVLAFIGGFALFTMVSTGLEATVAGSGNSEQNSMEIRSRPER